MSDGKSNKGSNTNKGNKYSGKTQRGGNDRNSRSGNHGRRNVQNDRRNGGSNRGISENDTRTNNDASWYQVTDQITRDAGLVSFNNPLGMPVNNILDNDPHYLPGVAAVWYAPTLGDASSPTSPINLQAKKLMSYLRSKVSAKLSFAAADAMMYLMAMDSMYSFYSYCVRAYGLHFAYIGMNRYYPQSIFDALKLDANSTSDWNGFRTWLNTWAYQLSQVFVPSTIDFFKRHMWMNANVYLDTADAKAQSYIFTPEFLYKWNGTADPRGTCLIPTAMPTAVGAQLATLEDLMAFGDAMLTDLLQDIDVSEISGLILRAFGEQNCVKMSTIPEEFAIAPVYNEEVMAQIHNATITGKFTMSTTPGVDSYGIVTQTEFDTLEVKYQTTTQYASLRHLGKHRFLDMKPLAPNVDEVFVATRLMASGTPDATSRTAVLTVFGTEVITRIELYALGGTSVTIDGALMDNMGTTITALALGSAFSYFPFVYIAHLNTDTTHVLKQIVGDKNNYTVLSTDELHKLHSAATMALFNIPTIGS